MNSLSSSIGPFPLIGLSLLVGCTSPPAPAPVPAACQESVHIGFAGGPEGMENAEEVARDCMRRAGLDVSEPHFVPVPRGQFGISNKTKASRAMAEAYPRHLRDAGLGGKVWLLVLVDEGGNLARVHIARSSGFPELDRAALLAAPSLRFHPIRYQGCPIRAWGIYSLNFHTGMDQPAANSRGGLGG